MSKATYLALAAASGLLIGATAPASAADLGGGCCADLEERVAELEATTARKGNRVVSLQIYGQVNKALLFFDNGEDSDAFVVDNDFSGSRFGFLGEAVIKPGWTAGYRMEFDVQDAASDKVEVDNDDPDDEIKIRINEVYVDSERFGRVTLGQGDSASNQISEISLGNSLRHSEVNVGNNLTVLGNNVLGDYADNLDGVSRVDRVRYDSPSIYGFVLSASWGEDDYYDVALRFKKEFNSIRVAAGIAYVAADEVNGNEDDLGEFEQVSGSFSVMHIPSGIFLSAAAGEKDFDDEVLSDASFWYAQAGIEKRVMSYGSTTFYGEYGLYEGFVENAEAQRWGVGLVQAIDSAAMDVYAQATFWDIDDPAFEDNGELTTILVGSRIKF
jgi:predicted porin